MLQTTNAASRGRKLGLGSLLIAGLLMIGSTPGLLADKSETIEATAEGTGTQVGHQFGVTLNYF